MKSTLLKLNSKEQIIEVEKKLNAKLYAMLTLASDSTNSLSCVCPRSEYVFTIQFAYMTLVM